MIHSCNIHCHSMDIAQVDLLGVEDKGKWLPFAFHMDIVIACKLTNDDEEDVTYGCTTVFTDHNDTYIIDTPYKEFLPLFMTYHTDASSESKKSDELNF